MSTAELTLHFADATTVNVRFDDIESGPLPFVNPLTAKDRADLRWYIETYAATSLADPDDREAKRIEARLTELGKVLFTAAFKQGDQQAYQIYLDFRRTATEPRVITINAQDATILALPWELLHDPTGVYLFRERPRISIRRKITGATGGRPPFRLRAKPQLHLLFVVSRPEGAGFLDPRADGQAVLDAIAEFAPGRVTCEFLRPATLNALVARLDDASQPPVDILHFDGHGIFRHLREEDVTQEPALYGKTVLSELQRERQLRKGGAADQPVGMGFLLFETAERKAHYVAAADLSENLFQAQVGLVVLSACQSAALDEGGDPLASVAGKLTTTGIPAILAMTHAVLVPTTKALFGHFYEKLAQGRPLTAALDDARAFLANNPDKYEVQRGDRRQLLQLRDWFVPTLYHSGHDGALLTTAATTTAAPAPRHNLRPRHEAGFFGRRRELWQIECWLSEETRRLSLTGFGGQGKTELALEAGRWLLRTGMFARAVFVDYAAVQGEEALGVAISTIGATLGESLLDAAAVTTALAAAPTLLILDNLEALPPAPLRELLDAAATWSTTGATRLLLTSRTPDFDHPAYRVEGTRHHRRLSLSGLGSAAYPDDALDWFGALYGLPPAPTVRPPTRAELIRLFDQVAFHPLSIAVLVGQLKTQRASHLADRLAAILATTAPAGAVAEGTPRSLVASLQLSLERLDDAARHAVRRLGVFQGGALETRLLEITELDAGQWPALRRQLENAALLEAEVIPGVNPPFLRFHPTLAPLLWAQLDRDEQAALTSAHRRRYYALAKYLYFEDDKTPEQARAIARRELPNLLYAVDGALAAGADFAVEFVNAVNKFLRIFGLNRLAAGFSERATHAAGAAGSDAWYLAQSNRGEQLLAAGRVAEAATLFTQILQQLGDVPSYQRAVTLSGLGRCYADGGRPDRAATHYRAGIAVTEGLEQTGNVKRHRGILYTDLADVLVDLGNFGAARANYEASLAIKREGGDQRGEGVVLGQLGTLALREGNLAEAVQRHHAALDLFRRLNEPASEAVAQHQLGRTFQAAKQWEQAEQHYRESACLKEQLGMIGGSNGATTTWNNLALVIANAGKVAAAEGWYRKAIEGGRSVGDQLPTSRALSNLADLLRHQPGRLAEARGLAEEALAIDQTLDPGASEIWNTYTILAEIAEQAGQGAAAVAYRRQARAAKRAFAGTQYEMRQFASVIAIVAQALRGDAKTRIAAMQLVEQLQQAGSETAKLADAITQLLAGERDADRLCDTLHYDPAMIVETILAALADPAVLAALLPEEDGA
ncbi:MAG: CHAT domain-containing protein [Caldilinea sp. CFX5]|nr:CHAT domain-containing protein [Caldilinea sp. CFX5]